MFSLNHKLKSACLVAFIAFFFVGCSRAQNDSIGIINNIEISAPGTDWDSVDVEKLQSEIMERFSETRDNAIKGDNVTTLPNPLPSIKPVKVMTGGEEWINTIIECMDDAGFTVTSGDGYHHLSYNGSNGGDFAMYKCQMNYPLFNGAQYLPRVRAEQLYYYQVNGLKPCLENLGYVVSNPPTLEQYLEASYNAVDLSDDYPGFDPMAEVENFLQGQMLNDLNNSTDSEKVEKEHYAKLRKVYDRCPALPADFWPELPEY